MQLSTSCHTCSKLSLSFVLDSCALELRGHFEKLAVVYVGSDPTSMLIHAIVLSVDLMMRLGERC